MLLTNIKDRYDSYRRQWDLGNELEARKEQKGTIVVVNEIVRKLEDIRDNLLPKNVKTDDTITSNPEVLLSDNDEDLSLKKEGWTLLLKSIKAKNCIPFLGTEPFSPWLPLKVKV